MYARYISKLRETVRNEAARYTDTSIFTQQESIDRVDAFAAKMQRGYFHQKVLRPSELELDPEVTPIASRHRSKRKPPKPAEVITICHEALVEKQLHRDIAMRHNISIVSVSKYTCKAKKNPKFMEELYLK